MKGTANAAANATSRRSDYMEPIPLSKVALFKKESGVGESKGISGR
jgi:hypothetical protein